MTRIWRNFADATAEIRRIRVIRGLSRNKFRGVGSVFTGPEPLHLVVACQQFVQRPLFGRRKVLEFRWDRFLHLVQSSSPNKQGGNDRTLAFSQSYPPCLELPSPTAPTTGSRRNLDLVVDPQGRRLKANPAYDGERILELL